LIEGREHMGWGNHHGHGGWSREQKMQFRREFNTFRLESGLPKQIYTILADEGIKVNAEYEECGNTTFVSKVVAKIGSRTVFINNNGSLEINGDKIEGDFSITFENGEIKRLPRGAVLVKSGPYRLFVKPREARHHGSCHAHTEDHHTWREAHHDSARGHHHEEAGEEHHRHGKWEHHHEDTEPRAHQEDDHRRHEERDHRHRSHINARFAEEVRRHEERMRARKTLFDEEKKEVMDFLSGLGGLSKTEAPDQQPKKETEATKHDDGKPEPHKQSPSCAFLRTSISVSKSAKVSPSGFLGKRISVSPKEDIIADIFA